MKNTTSTTIIDSCEIAAYQTWKHNRRGPAYMRGMPTWVWTSALCQRQRRSRAAIA
jgi:hypothetical protein